MRRGFLLAILSVLAPPAFAGDPPPSAAPPVAPARDPKPLTPEQAADAVLAAVKAKDDAAIKALAAKDDPDPWLVADELLARNEHDAASAFAKAVPRVDVEELPAYVASRSGKRDDAAARKALDVANAALAAGKPKDALEALGLPDDAPPADVVDIRRAFGRGLALSALGRLEESAAAYLVAADAAERVGWLARVSKALHQAGSSASDRSDYRGALSAWERLRVVAEARGDRVGVARTLVGIGDVHYSLGNYPKALDHYDRALKICEDLGDGLGVAVALSGIGLVHYSLGNLPKALEYDDRALKMAAEIGNRRVEAATLSNIGLAHLSLGNYAKALEYDERTLKMEEDLGDRAGAAGTIVNMGSVHQKLGNYPKALEYYERGLKEAEAVGERQFAANALSNIGSVYALLGSYLKALEHHERALKMMEELGDREGVANSLGAIGSDNRSLGNYAKALEYEERALKMMEELGDREGVAGMCGNVGSVHLQLGNYPKAIQFLERSVSAAEKLGANGLLAWTLGQLAMVRLKSGDAGRAMSDAQEAVRLLKTLVGGLGEEQGATARGQYADLFATGIAAAAKVDDVRKASFFLESGRAGSLLESLDARDSLRHAAIPADLRLAEAAARAVEARALVAYTKSQDGGDRAEIRAREEELQAARANVQEVVERIQRDAKKEAHLWYPVATPVEDIQGFLAPREALVLYGLSEKDDEGYALVLTREEARIVRLGKSSDVVAACEALHLGDRDTTPAAALDRLRELLVKPLALPKETKRLLVSPEGPLSYVPFAALVPDLDVAYEASGSTYGVLLEEKEKHGEQVLALADADYTARFDPTSLDLYVPAEAAALGTTRGGRLAPLPGTREEAMAVADVRLFGKDASESGLRAALAKKKERWHSVHFACHGIVNPDRPTLSSLVLTPEGENDGFLTALEVLKMEIPSDLVVLSACETGKGKIAGGEGIVGLTRAFMYAGSPRVICSLWKVDDEATRALMTKFYELWNPKDASKAMGTAAALRTAEEFIRDNAQHPEWKHPYYWAAWVLWGLPE